MSFINIASLLKNVQAVMMSSTTLFTSQNHIHMVMEMSARLIHGILITKYTNIE